MVYIIINNINDINNNESRFKRRVGDSGWMVIADVLVILLLLECFDLMCTACLLCIAPQTKWVMSNLHEHFTV